jgi:hypothetical protein
MPFAHGRCEPNALGVLYLAGKIQIDDRHGQYRAIGVLSAISTEYIDKTHLEYCLWRLWYVAVSQNTSTSVTYAGDTNLIAGSNTQWFPFNSHTQFVMVAVFNVWLMTGNTRVLYLDQAIFDLLSFTAVGTRCAVHMTPLYQQKLALTSATGGGRSVGIVLSRTKATQLKLCPYPSTSQRLP